MSVPHQRLISAFTRFSDSLFLGFYRCTVPRTRCDSGTLAVLYYASLRFHLYDNLPSHGRSPQVTVTSLLTGNSMTTTSVGRNCANVTVCSVMYEAFQNTSGRLNLDFAVTTAETNAVQSTINPVRGVYMLVMYRSKARFGARFGARPGSRPMCQGDTRPNRGRTVADTVRYLTSGNHIRIPYRDDDLACQ